MPFVNGDNLSDAENEYVCWIDIMGTKNKMSSSVKTCAVFICRFHAAILECQTDEINIITYPVMDGVYITAKKQSDVLNFITKVFVKLAMDFFSTVDNNHRFIIKAALSFGPIIHGNSITSEVSRVYAANEDYKNSILLGLPMIQAYTNEKNAPPFGVYIHESARAFAPEGEKPITFNWYKWYLSGFGSEYRKKLYDAVIDYFSFSFARSINLDYPQDKITIHRKMFEEYFSDESSK